MADFWQRLAARSLGEIPRVEPAIAPLYAPGRVFAQPLDWIEETQETALFDPNPAPILASRLVESLPPTSPFIDLTRSPQAAENRTPIDRPIAEIEPEQNPVQRDRPVVNKALPPPTADLVPQVQPIAFGAIASEPVASAQTSLPPLQPSIQPVNSLANLASITHIQINPPVNPQIPPSIFPLLTSSLAQPIPDLRLEAEKPATDRPCETSASETSTSESSPVNPLPIAIAPVIVPVISTVQPQPVQPQVAQPADRSVSPISLIPPPPIAPLIRRVEPTEAIAESPERRNLQPVALPTIQVTIGRIEIRTTPPAANRPKPPRSTPQLSLQDYLKQQDLKQPGNQPDPKHQGGKR